VLKEADPKFQVIEDSDEEENVVKNN